MDNRKMLISFCDETLGCCMSYSLQLLFVALRLERGGGFRPSQYGIQKIQRIELCMSTDQTSLVDQQRLMSIDKVSLVDYHRNFQRTIFFMLTKQFYVSTNNLFMSTNSFYKSTSGLNFYDVMDSF